MLEAIKPALDLPKNGGLRERDVVDNRQTQFVSAT